ncbi:MAG: hypothetical protein ACLU4J_19400 [Butyricimonas paravirosa]
MEEIERIHQYAINDKEVKEQVNAYLSGLDETEKTKTSSLTRSTCKCTRTILEVETSRV